MVVSNDALPTPRLTVTSSEISMRLWDSEDAIVLSAMMASFMGQRQIDRLNAGSNRQGLNYRQLRSFFVPWPKTGGER